MGRVAVGGVRMNLYDIAIARKLSSGGGGGDYTTANVTVSVSTDTDAVILPVPIDMEGQSGLAVLYVSKNNQGVYPVTMYKGLANGGMRWLGTTPTITTTGAITYNSDYGFIITGDGTITIS